MGKTARRYINETPSSPSSSPYLNNKQQQQKSVTHHQFWSHYDFQLATPSLSTTASPLSEPLSQVKNVENKTSSTAIPIQSLPSSSSSSSSSSLSGSSTSYNKATKTSSSQNVGVTQKPATTTYKAFTTTYKSSSSTRSYINYINRSDILTEQDRLRMREEFYASYDVMTGIRIAATLGGFFALMVFLIVYKSRSHSVRAMNDPRITAQAEAAVQEEEDRELQEAFEKTAYSLYQDELDLPQLPLDYNLNRDRIASIGNVSFNSCPPFLINPNHRFSSIGGYSTLLQPSRRPSDVKKSKNRRQSSLESSTSRMLSAYHLNDNYSNQNENFFNESDGEEAGDEFDQRFTTTAEIASYPHGFLSVPRAPDSRRSSGMTCCSTESSFLERRCSAITLGLSSLAPLSRASSSRRASRDTSFDHETHQHFPGIHIIEATPKSSPCPSERQSHLTCREGMDHMKILGRFKRRRHEENSIDSISEYPDEVTQPTSNNGDNGDESRALSDNVVNSNSNTQQQQHQNHHQKKNSKKLMSSNNNNHQNKLDDDISHNKSNINNNENENGNNNNNNVERRAPLASLSSFKMSSAECADSMEEANGSVFDDASCADTDDDLEQFSTDSDEISLQSPPSTDQHVPSGSTGGSTVKCDNSVILVKSGGGEKTLRDSSKTEDIERQKNDKMSTIRPVNYLITSDKRLKSNSSECVATVDYNNEKYTSLKPSTPTSSAVILEMPMLATKQDIEHHDSDTHRLLDPAIDLSLTIDDDEKCTGGTSNRKWSKETLF